MPETIGSAPMKSEIVMSEGKRFITYIIVSCICRKFKQEKGKGK